MSTGWSCIKGLLTPANVKFVMSSESDDQLRSRSEALDVYADAANHPYPIDHDLSIIGFPCQNSSQAGHNAGRTGAVRRVIQAIERMLKDGKGPSMVVLENVWGLYQNHKRVIMRLVRVLKSHGYNALLVHTVAALKVICENNVH